MYKSHHVWYWSDGKSSKPAAQTIVSAGIQMFLQVYINELIRIPFSCCWFFGCFHQGVVTAHCIEFGTGFTPDALTDLRSVGFGLDIGWESNPGFTHCRQENNPWATKAPYIILKKLFWPHVAFTYVYVCFTTINWVEILPWIADL